MREGTKDTAIALGSRLAVLAFGIAIQSALARLLGTDGRGSYAVCLIFATVLGIFFTFGVDRAGQYFVASGRMSRSEGVTSSLLLLLAGAGVAIVTGRLLMLLDLEFFQKADHSSFLIALGIIPFVGLTDAFALYFIGIRRFKWMAVVEVVNIGIHLLATLVLVIWVDMGVNGALLAIITAGVVSAAVSLALLRKEGALERCRRTSAGYRELVRYGLRVLVAKLSAVVHLRIGTMLLAFFVAPSEIGLFAAASALAMRVIVVPRSIEKALFSRVAGDERGRPELVAQAARVSMIVSGVALAVLCVFIGPLVRVLLSSAFAQAVPLALIIVPGVFARASTTVLAAYFMGTGRPAVCSVAVALGTLINIAVLLLLLPVTGLAGAAWAMTAGYVATAIVFTLEFRKASGQQFGETWMPRRDDVRLLMELPGTLRRKNGDREGAAA